MPWDVIIPVGIMAGFALVMIFVLPRMKGGG
jgi:hypothetical protein